MKKWFKRAVISGVVLLIVAFIGVAVFILNFDPSAYKDKLAQLIKIQYNRELVVKGDIDVSLFPRIGLTVNQLSLSEPDSKELFATINKAHLAVALWPLISNRFLVDHLAIDGLNVNIRRTSDGKYNFEDLLRSPLLQSQQLVPQGRKKTSSLQQRVQHTDFKIDVAGLTLDRGILHYHNDSHHFILENMTIRTGRITAGQQFDLSLTGHLKEQTAHIDTEVEVNGLMLLKPLDHTYAFNRLNVDLLGKWGNITLTQANVKGDLSINSLENALKGTNVDVRLHGEGNSNAGVKELSVELTAPTLNYNVSDLSLAVDDFILNSEIESTDKQRVSITLDAPALNISPSGAGGKPLTGKVQIKGSAKQVDTQFSLDKITGTAVSLNVDKIKLSSRYKIDGDRSLGLELFSSGKISVFKQSIELPDISGDFVLQDQQIQTIPLKGHVQTLLGEQKINFLLKALLAPSAIDIKGDIVNFFHPQVSFDVSGDQLDLKAFLKDIRLPLGRLKEEINSISHASKIMPIVATQVTQPVVSAQDIVPSKLTLKQALLSRLSGIGTFNFAHVFYDRIQLNNVGATLLFNHNKVRVKSVRADAYSGKLSANGEYSLADHTLTGNLRLSNIQLDALQASVTEQPKLSGIAQLGVVFSSQGDTEQALFKALKANITVNARQGKIRGINIDEILSQPQDYANPWDLSAQLASEEGNSTQFNQIVLETQLQDQQLFIQKFMVSTPTLMLTARPTLGSYHLGIDHLYLPAILKTKRPLKMKKGSVTIQIKRVELPLLMLGSLASPTVKLQLDKLLDH